MSSYIKISIGIFLLIAVSRFVPHPPNFTSLIALSFYVPAILGKKYIPWSKKLMQLSEMTPFNMCITKLNYSNNSLNISAISKIEDKNINAYLIYIDLNKIVKV